jgi:hypothetical protein
VKRSKCDLRTVWRDSGATNPLKWAIAPSNDFSALDLPNGDQAFRATSSNDLIASDRMNDVDYSTLKAERSSNLKPLIPP